MYGNFITIAQRRINARFKEENRDRIQVCGQTACI
jgi:hypothetical protein